MWSPGGMAGTTSARLLPKLLRLCVGKTEKGTSDQADEKTTKERLTQLYHKRLPDWEILANYYMAERVRWRGLARAG